MRLWWLVALVVSAGSAAAQYPTRQIEMIVPISPGGGMDQQARLLAELAEPHLQQKLVILNRPGAGGTIGMARLTQSAPDGYTIGAVWNGPLTGSVHLQPVPYGLDDYIPVIQFSTAPFVFCVAPEFPANNGAEFIAKLRQSPDEYTYGHEGVGGILHLGAERIFKSLGLKLRAIPFPGASETARNFAGGHINIYAGGIASIQGMAEAGKAKCLLLTSAARNSLFPQAAGLDDLGIRDAETLFWRAIVVPKGTPPEIITKLEDVFRRAAASDRFKTFLAGLGEAGSSLSGPALRDFIRREYETLGALAQSAK
jgi:tripartite-type tricarboxylate transporter receptor subunit TctC